MPAVMIPLLWQYLLTFLFRNILVRDVFVKKVSDIHSDAWKLLRSFFELGTKYNKHTNTQYISSFIITDTLIFADYRGMDELRANDCTPIPNGVRGYGRLFVRGWRYKSP